jgi:polyhydroxyalkanoate synthesis regulator phasin
MNRTTKITVAVVAAVVLLATGVLAVTAFAQTPTGQTPGDVFWSTLASKLNVSQDALKSAVREAAKAVVAQTVKDGKLKQDAADKLNQKIDQMPLDKVPFPITPAKRAAARNTAQAESLRQMLDTAANTLNISRSDLLAELRDGLTLGQIAQQKGFDPNKLKAAMLAVPYTRIDEAVKNGKLTQDKANEMKAKLDKGIDLNKRIQVPGQAPAKPQSKSTKP